MLFWIGVPVNNKRLRHWKLSNVFHRPLDEFLIFCASSRIMYCHFTALKYCWSCRIYCKLIQSFMSPKRCCFAYQLITCDQNVERCVLVVADIFLTPKLPEGRSVLHVSPIRQCFESWDKTGDLLLPVVQGGSWGDNEERSPDVVSLCKICKQ